MVSRDFAFLSAGELRDLLRRREVSPVEIIAATLAAIGASNAALGAFVTVTEASALAEAHAAERRLLAGEPLPPLFGVSVSIKDLEPMAGVRFTRGSLASDVIATEDALSVERLRAAGAIIVGKTNTAEFGFGTTGENRVFGVTRNPWDPRLTPGGSSAGAAASVAAGITPIAQGSDGGGSVRVPAAFCHVFGLKPTQGRIPRRLRGDQSWNVVATSTVGPIARTVRDAAVMLRVMAGAAEKAEFVMMKDAVPAFDEMLGRGVAGLRVALDIECCGAVEPVVAAGIREAAGVFQSLGARVEEIAFRPDPADRLFDIFFDYFSARAYQSHGSFLDDPRSAALLTDYVTDCLRRGKAQSAARHIEYLNRIGYYRHQIDALFARYDLLLMPVASVPPSPIGASPAPAGGAAWSEPRWNFFRTHLFNLTGNPAASLPIGFSPDDRPLAMQLVGRWGDDATVLAAAAFEEARPWRQRLPAGSP